MSLSPVEVNACPRNAECIGSLQVPAPDADYWVDRRSIEYADRIYKCSRLTCKGAEDANDPCWSYLSYGNATEKNDCDSSDLQCSHGATGVLCGACIDGYSFNPTSQSCQTCHMDFSDVSAIIIATIAIIIIIGVYWVRSSPWLLSRCSMIRFDTLETGSVKVALVTAQIVTSISWNLNIEVKSIKHTLLFNKF